MTLYEIADECNVSIATVSRVLNNKGNVKTETKEKILQVLNKSNNQYKYLVSTEKNQTIAIIVPDIHNPFYGEIIKGVTKIADRYNFDILLYDTHDSQEKEFKYLKKVIKQKISGLILMSSSDGILMEESKELIEKKNKFPIVLIDKELQNLQLDGVFFDDITGIYLLTEYLIKKGHKDIHILTGKKESEVTQKRLQGFKNAFSNYDLKFSEKLVYYSSFSEEEVINRVIEKMFRKKEYPKVIVSCSGPQTIALIKGISQANLILGKDVVIVSFDDVEILHKIGIYITSAHTDLKKMGEAGFDLLYKKINASLAFTNKMTVTPTIIER